MRPAIVLSVAFIAAFSSCRPESHTTGAAASASAKKAVPPAKSAGKAPDAAKKQEQPPAVAPAETKKESPIPDIPEGRSKPPSVTEWQEAKPLNTQEPNSQPEKCEMKVVREWLKVYCYGKVSSYSEMFGFGEKQRDYFASLRKGKSADFVLRLRKGKTQKLRIQYETEPEAVLYVSWPPDADKPVHIALGRGNKPEKPDTDKAKKAVKAKKR